MKVLHKKNQGKSMRKEGIYPGEIGHNKVRKIRFSEKSRMSPGAFRMKSGNEIFRIASE